MSDTVFKSAQDRESIDAWYERFEDKISAPVEHTSVTTSLGDNHVLAVGRAENPPLLCVHGAMGSSAHTVGEIDGLARDYYLLAPDVPGRSVRGLDERLPLDDGAHGRWLLEVLDGLGLESAAILGVSWGGFVCLQAASIAPQRVEKLVLVVPAGVVDGPIWEATRDVMVPLAMYKLFPSEKRLRRLMEGLATTWDEDWANYLGEALGAFRLDLNTPPLTQPEDLADFEAPTLVVAADADLSFPGAKLLERMESLIPHAETELLEDCRHMPPTTDEFREWLAGRIRRFLEGSDARTERVAETGT